MEHTVVKRARFFIAQPQRLLRIAEYGAAFFEQKRKRFLQLVHGFNISAERQRPRPAHDVSDRAFHIVKFRNRDIQSMTENRLPHDHIVERMHVIAYRDKTFYAAEIFPPFDAGAEHKFCQNGTEYRRNRADKNAP